MEYIDRSNSIHHQKTNKQQENSAKRKMTKQRYCRSWRWKWWLSYRSRSRPTVALLVIVCCFCCFLCLITFTATGDDDNNYSTDTSSIWVDAFSPRHPLLSSSTRSSSNSNSNKHHTYRSTASIKQQPLPDHEPQQKKKNLVIHCPTTVLFSTTTSNNDDDDDEMGEDAVAYSIFSKTPKQVLEGLLQASSSKNNNNLLDLETILSSWGELTEIVDDGDISVQELQDLFLAASKGNDGLDQSTFEAFYRSIDDLFDDDDEDEDDESDDYNSSEDNGDGGETKAGTTESVTTSDTKSDLLSYLEELQNLDCEKMNREVYVGKRQPWGLDFTDKERTTVFEKIDALCVEGDSSNLLRVGSIINSEKELTRHVLGAWDLKYTSSRTMLINKSLSGLGRSTSDLVENKGLRMNLKGTHYFGEVEFVETFAGKGDDDEIETAERENDPIRIDFKVSGEWMIETGTQTDPRTGRPSVSLRVEVDTVAYGPQKSKADQWDSLGPIKLVDMLYLDETVMVVRGNFNLEALFVYERIL